ncbi:MAG: sulfite exporter TauE/SafE family protein [Verrucomicrobia bacterium]|nr:sulfite exporter TauE/SafE family protein [Verrucomicrobiota bacterium]
MSPEHLPWLSISVLVVAFLYSSVGHAGASGYLAVMAIFGMEQGLIKPTALGLNIFVALLATWQFYRAGYFSWSLFWPLALLSIPGAFLGGFLHLPTPIFKIVLGGVLLLSAGRFLIPTMVEKAVTPPARPLAIGLGGGLGLLSRRLNLSRRALCYFLVPRSSVERRALISGLATSMLRRFVVCWRWS